tara:strand:- start:5273 stop:6421 length:1149 start_codon:yes stop_codon:yes gene_type:complete
MNSNMNVGFEDLNINDNLLRGIYGYGFERPSNIQIKAIKIINSGKELIAQSHSGTGKTGAFLIGCLNNIEESLNHTQCIIILPTHELANQCYDICNEFIKFTKLKLGLLIGKIRIQDSINILRLTPHIVIGTPGRILDMINKRELFTDKVKFLVMDEADEILSDGFQENIYNIIKFHSKETKICLFSATIPDDILELSNQFLNDPEKILVEKENLTLDGIKQFYILIEEYNWKYQILLDLYSNININKSIIYVNHKNLLLNVHKFLEENNIPSVYISSELTSQERKKNMNEFKNGSARIMISTDLLSRGIDIQQLSLVINFDIPSSKDVYIHRIGRSGRYGRKGVAINFVFKDKINDIKEIENFYSTKIEEMPENISDYINN